MVASRRLSDSRGGARLPISCLTFVFSGFVFVCTNVRQVMCSWFFVAMATAIVVLLCCRFSAALLTRLPVADDDGGGGRASQSKLHGVRSYSTSAAGGGGGGGGGGAVEAARMRCRANAASERLPRGECGVVGGPRVGVLVVG